MGFVDNIKNGWNAFLGRDPTDLYKRDSISYGSSYNPGQIHLGFGNERTTLASVYNRIALDCASCEISHVRLDDNDRFIGYADSGLQYCLSTETNIDQTPRAFIQDAVMSMFDEGCVAIVPTDTDVDPITHQSFDIHTLRTGRVVTWNARTVKVNVYNDRNGKREDIVLPKRCVSIIYNPFYAVMNEPNSTYRRYVNKLSMLDTSDKDATSGKLNMIIQLPYLIKSPGRKKQAEERRNELEKQMSESANGIGYIDGTERITQLNRSIDNNLQTQIQYIETTLKTQLGITDGILNGTASEQEMTNYLSRCIEPVVAAIADEMKRKFLTKTARTQKQSILFFRDPFKIMPISTIATVGQAMTQIEAMSSNEVRQIIGLKPSSDPRADELRNKNLSKSDAEVNAEESSGNPNGLGEQPETMNPDNFG